jgi:N-methylhydantoinase A
MLGIDVGGTFTDFIDVDKTGTARVVKTATTPDQPARGVLEGLERLSETHGALEDYLKSVDLIVHGTTITTNAVITGNFAKTGYVTTEGFRHLLNSRRGIKRSAFTAKEAPPEPIVPQYLVRAVEERIDKDGNVITPLNEADVEQAARFFKRHKVEAVAVNLMFSFLSGTHETRVGEILTKHLPGVYISLSHRVLPHIRMYERGSTTVFNACVGPLLERYIGELRSRLKQSGFSGRLLTMQSNGGVMSPEVVKDFGANTLLSGPASGPVAALHFSRPHGLDDLVTIDMGGTSLDACLIRGGRPAITKHSEVAEYALAVPSLDIRAIGAGGGSLAAVDGAGRLTVGPNSAGAVPGPACYGMGGERPTVTDADLVLGYINPENFLGGERPLDTELAVQAIDRHVAEPLGISREEAAGGVVQLINAQMANGVRQVSIERGFDPRDAALVVAGGAGPLHGCGIAEELDLELVLVPKASSVLCAAGMLTTDLRHDLVHYAALRLDDDAGTARQLNGFRKALVPEGRKLLKDERVAASNQRFEFAADMMFEGQFNVLETPLPSLAKGSVTAADIKQIREDFRRHHEAVYGYTLEDAPIEIQSLRLTAIGRTRPPQFGLIAKGKAQSRSAQKARRTAWLQGKKTKLPVYEGSALRAGNRITGPAIVEHATTTVLVNPGWSLKVDPMGSYALWPSHIELNGILRRLSRGRVKSLSKLAT